MGVVKEAAVSARWCESESELVRQSFMASNAATPVPAEGRLSSSPPATRKGAVQEVATHDRLYNCERQSLSHPVGIVL